MQCFLCHLPIRKKRVRIISSQETAEIDRDLKVKIVMLIVSSKSTKSNKERKIKQIKGNN